MLNDPMIAAMQRGPGPGRYALPSTLGHASHDATKRKEPAYSFGRRLKVKEKNDSPGPAYFINPQVTRTGRDGTPSYSLLSKQKRIGMFKTPHPGTYYPEKVHPQREPIAPKYSMGSRSRYRKQDQNPPPSKYILPSVLGPKQCNKMSPASYSLIGHSKIGGYLEDLTKTPGPGHTADVAAKVYMPEPPKYSLGSRNYMPGDRVQKPGPGAHHPENVTINRMQAPRYSLGVRHSEFVCPLIA